MRRCGAIQTFFQKPTRPVQVSFAEEAGPDEEKEAKHEDACFDAMSSAAAPADLTPTEFPLTGGLTVGEIAFGGETGDDKCLVSTSAEAPRACSVWRIFPIGSGVALRRVSTT